MFDSFSPLLPLTRFFPVSRAVFLHSSSSFVLRSLFASASRSTSPAIGDRAQAGPLCRNLRVPNPALTTLSFPRKLVFHYQSRCDLTVINSPGSWKSRCALPCPTEPPINSPAHACVGDLGASDMSVDRRLQRSSWKADAIRRGDIKISGPIPIAEETTQQVEEERDTESGNLVPQSRLPDGLSTHAPQPPTEPENESMNSESVAIQTSDTTGNEVHRLRHKVSSPSLRAVSESQPAPFSLQATFQPNSTPISLMRRGSAVTEPKKKRKGSLRDVFRKVFGRKARESEDAQGPRHGYHRSVRVHSSSTMVKLTCTGTPRCSRLPSSHACRGRCPADTRCAGA